MHRSTPSNNYVVDNQIIQQNELQGATQNHRPNQLPEIKPYALSSSTHSAY